MGKRTVIYPEHIYYLRLKGYSFADIGHGLGCGEQSAREKPDDLLLSDSVHDTYPRLAMEMYVLGISMDSLSYMIGIPKMELLDLLHSENGLSLSTKLSIRNALHSTSGVAELFRREGGKYRLCGNGRGWASRESAM